MGEFILSGEPLPLAPSLTGDSEQDVIELLVFHNKLLDYLRRMTAKLSAPDVFEPPDGGDTTTATAVESLMLTLSSPFPLSGTPDTIIWDEVQREDTPYSYNATTGVITLVDAGFYVMFVDLYIPGDISHTTHLIDGDSNILGYSKSYFFGGGAAAVFSESSMIPFAAHAGMTVELQVLAASGGDVEEDASRLLVMKLGAFIGSGGVDPCDGFDVWQLCP